MQMFQVSTWPLLLGNHLSALIQNMHRLMLSHTVQVAASADINKLHFGANHRKQQCRLRKHKQVTGTRNKKPNETRSQMATLDTGSGRR